VNPAWVAALVTLTTAVAGLVYWFTRTMWHLFQRVDQFLEDWNGRAATPGHAGLQGVMERLVDLETNNESVSKRLDSQDKDLKTIKAEVTFNTGHSIKDTVRDILDTVRKMQPPA
jgi:hypothetical protein